MATPELQDNAPTANQRTERYSIFTRKEKRYIIVFLVAVAGWFSTLSSFIYYPVIALVARDIHTSITHINLTVTSYLAISGVAPALVGDAADMLGRRPMYIVTLTIYLIANIGIALQHSFVALLLLRMLQSLGISGISDLFPTSEKLLMNHLRGTFSVAYGVIADISTPAERGSYVAALSLGITTAPSVGPLIGGALGYSVGWRWIFWFLCIVSGSCLTAMALTMPETARNLVGNGSVPPPRLSRLPLEYLIRRPDPRTESDTSERRIKWHLPNPAKSLILLGRKDTLCIVVGGAILYTLYSCLHASLSSLFIKLYKLNQLEAGLIYLPFGIGNTIATIFSGKIIDRDYRLTAKHYDLPVEKVKGDDLAQFPIEEARTRSIFLPFAITTAAVIGFGWTLEARVHIAAPLVLQFITGFAIQMCFNINNTLLIDVNQEAPAAAQASSNIIRCASAALAIAVLQDVLDAIGPGWTFTILGLSCLITIGLCLLIRKKGMTWRLGKSRKIDAVPIQAARQHFDLGQLEGSDKLAACEAIDPAKRASGPKT